MNVKSAIMQRDGISSEEADEMIARFQDSLSRVIEDMSNPIEGLEEIEDLLRTHLGLEPDYLMELL